MISVKHREVSLPVKDRVAYNEYMRKYMLARYHRRRAAAVERLGGKCVDCGSTELLEIDHVDPSAKAFDIGRALATWAEDRLRAEIAKCALRCDECHKAKSRVEMATRPKRTLSANQVSEIRARYKPYDKTNGATALAAEFNVSRQTIENAIHHRTWRSLEEPEGEP